MGMQVKEKSSVKNVIDKTVMIGAAVCGIGTLVLNIIAAHL